MKKLHLFHILSVVLILALTMAFVTPAQAKQGKPYHEVYDASGDWYLTGICDFDIHVVSTGHGIATYWFNEDGSVSKDMGHDANVQTTLSANGKTANLQYHSTTTELLEYRDDGITFYTKWRGGLNIITVPGQGRIWGGGGLAE